MMINTELPQTLNRETEIIENEPDRKEEIEAKTKPQKKKYISKVQKKCPKPEGINIGEWNET